jgi:PAT family beta-lactamase induction signal transducer AmpG
VLAQTMMAVSVAALLALDDLAASFDVLLVLLLVHTIFNAMQNVAVEALAVELLEPDERGKANGLMYGAKYVGGGLGGWGMAKLMDWSGMRTAIAAQAVVLLAITLVPLLVHERSGASPERTTLRELVRTIGRLVRLRSIRLTSATMLCSYVGIGMLSAIGFGLFIKQLDWSDIDYGAFAGGPALISGAVGAMGGGWLADRLGHRRLAAIASAALAVAWLVFAIGKALWTTREFGYGLLVIEPFANGAMTAGLFSVCMATSLPRTAATQYVIYTSLMNLASMIGAKLLASHAVAWLGYRGTYVDAAIIQLVAIVLILRIDPDEARRELETSGGLPPAHLKK